MAAIETPHIRTPFGRGSNGKVITVEQGSDEHVRSRCLTVLQCPPGARWARPEFGSPQQTFKGVPLKGEEVQAALLTFADLEDVIVEDVTQDGFMVRVEDRILLTQAGTDGDLGV